MKCDPITRACEATIEHSAAHPPAIGAVLFVLFLILFTGALALLSAHVKPEVVA